MGDDLIYLELRIKQTVLWCFRYQDILHSINLTKKGNPGLKTCDGHQELLKFIRSDIIEVASRLQKGGLGYMDDTSEFEERVSEFTLFTPLRDSLPTTHLTSYVGCQVRELEKLQDFGECLITLQESVIKKFLQGFMAPKQKKKKKVGGEESSTAVEEVDDQKKLAEEARVSVCLCVSLCS